MTSMRLATASLAALLALSSRLSAQSSPPPPPPSDSVGREAVALIESGNAARRGAWIARTLSDKSRASDSASTDLVLAQLHQLGAPFQVLGSSVAGRHRWVRLMSARTGRVVMLDLPSDRAEPAKLAPVEVLESHAAISDSIVWPATRPRDDAAAMAVVRRNLERLAGGGGYSGTVYVGRGDTVLLAQGYGLADREDSVANS